MREYNLIFPKKSHISNNSWHWFAISWTISAPGPLGTYLSIPPLKNDPLRSSTVLPYLDAYHYGSDEVEQDYYTEHDLTGNLYSYTWTDLKYKNHFTSFSSEKIGINTSENQIVQAICIKE